MLDDLPCTPRSPYYTRHTHFSEDRIKKKARSRFTLVSNRKRERIVDSSGQEARVPWRDARWQEETKTEMRTRDSREPRLLTLYRSKNSREDRPLA